MRHYFLYLLVTLFLSINSLNAQQRVYFPDKNSSWESADPSDYNIDPTKLQEAVDFVLNNEYSGSRDLRIAILKGFAREPYHRILGPTKKRGGPAGMILKKGRIIAQWGDVKRVDMTFSVTKSFLSTVAGLAYDHKLMTSEHDKVASYIWDGTFEGDHNNKITWEHLLNQSSDWTGELWGGKDWADRPPREGGVDDWKMRELREPGMVMEYNDVRVNVLAYSLTHLWRKPVPLVLKNYIMDPIGASSTWRWYGYDNAWTEIDGIQMKSVSGGGHSGGGMFINAEDMARFGLLFMNKGKWKDTQLISEDWINKATSPSQANNTYGYMWWLNSPGNRQWKGFSDKVFSARGFGGNYIVIDPEQEIVVVTRWLEPSTLGTFMQKLYAAL
jgi:CubicO group peptidase (beta-lactamase class C family)